MNSSRSATSTRSRRSTRREAPEGFHEAHPKSEVRREPVLWSTDPMTRDVHLGPVPQKLSTRTITWYDREHQCVATSIVIYNDQGQEVTELRAVFGGPIDPILLHRLHRLVGALKFIDGQQLGLATAAVTNKTPHHLEDFEYDPADAEAELRNQLAEGYDAAINLLSNDVSRDITLLRECDCQVLTAMVTDECIAGRLQFTQQLADLGVTSPEQIRARDAARAAILDPLKPFLDSFAESHGLKASDRKHVELVIIDLASRGITDNDLLVGYGLMELTNAKVKPVMSLTNLFVGNAFGLQLRGPDAVGIAAKQVKQLMPDSSRDEQWTRWALTGIQHDLKNDNMPVKRTDLR